MTATTPTPASVTPVNVDGIVQLWHWWTGELKSMLPATVMRWLDGDTATTNVAVDERGIMIFADNAGGTKPSLAQQVPLDAIANSPVLRALIASGCDRVRLVLSAEQALVKTITLPLATEENLRAVVGFELDRHTPFTPDQAYYDVQIVRRDVQQEQIVVSLAVASKSEVVALVETLRRAGLGCAAIGIDESISSNARAFDLQPAIDKPAGRLSRMHLINLGLLGLAAALALVAIILPIWQKREAVKVLVQQSEKSGTEFLVSERVYSEYTKLAAEYNFLATKKHAVYPALQVLEELARTFPDTTWVQRLELKASNKVREVTILGEAQSASKVIENLEQSPMSLFQNTKQLTQTMRMGANSERFHVSAEIKPRAVPAAEGLDAIPATVAVVPTSAPAALVTPPAAASVAAPAAASSAPLLTPNPAPTPTKLPATPAKQSGT
jgi:general secretion pathway protein L